MPEPRQPSTPEAAAEMSPHFSIPGFEQLPAKRQDTFLRIPPAALNKARPLIEAEIAAYGAKKAKREEGQAEASLAQGQRTKAATREAKASVAIDTYRRAEGGDETARAELADHSKAVLGKEPDDDEILRTILVNESTDPFAQDTAMDLLLTDEQAKETQAVFDLFQEFRGDLPSADNALAPQQQIDFFLRLTQGKGLIRQRLDFARAVLTDVTKGGKMNLYEGLANSGALKGSDLVEPAIDALATATARQVQGGDPPSGRLERNNI